MAYSHTTLTQAENALATLLSDLSGAISKVRWVSGELQLILLESIRTWSGLTGLYEGTSDPLTVSAGTLFLDLPTLLPTLRGYTLTVRDLIGPIQYHLYEPYDPIDGTGMSEMVTFDEIVQAVQRRRDQFLGETGIRITRSVLPTSPATIAAGQEHYDLPDTTLDVRRAAWIDTGTEGKTSVLRPSSHWSIHSSPPRITGTPDLPRSYTLHERAPIVMELNPVPAMDGRLDLLTVESGAALVAADSTLLGIPDDFAWVVKWGALADLLSKDGPMRDYARALYCERRYRVGVAAALSKGVLVDATINGRPAQMTTIDGLDNGRPNWQSRTGTPRVLATCGGASNLLAIADPPSADTQVTLQVVRSVPVPADGTEYLQVSREHLDLILGYAAHVAMFKIMGQELAATTHMADSFYKAAIDAAGSDTLRAAFEGTIDRPDGQKAAQGVKRATGETLG